MLIIERSQQRGENRLGFDCYAVGPQLQKDAYSIANMGADVENERARRDELAEELAVAAGAAGLCVVD